jgi:cation:H+ antiporter
MTIVLLAVGMVALVVGAELLVRGASSLAAIVGLSPLIVGLTVVAFGTSAPELAVSVSSALNGQADLALGNVVGSNIFNLLLILGLSSLIIPLVVDQKLIWFDVPLMVVISALVLLLGLDGRINRIEGSTLFAGLIAYTTWCVRMGLRESASVPMGSSSNSGVTEPTVRTRGEVDQATTTNEKDSPETQSSSLWAQLLLIAAGLGLLVLGSNCLVSAAVEIARWLGVSELIIGLTVIAGGTSLPEVATSLIAAIRGQRDIAVGNVVGSNIFNLLGVLGLTAAIVPDGVPIAAQALIFDLPVMLAVAVACLPVFFTGHVISRWEGGVFLAYFLAYTAALVLMATDSQAFPLFRSTMAGFVIPLTVITIVAVTIRAIRARRGAPDQQSKRHLSEHG